MKHATLFAMVLLLVAACGSTGEKPVAGPIESGSGGDSASPMVTDEEVPEQELLDPNRIVARVNDEIITVRSIQAEFGDALLSIGDPTDARYRQALERFALDMIIGRLFLQAAGRLGVTITKQDLKQVVDDAEAALKKRDTTLDEDLRSRGIARWEWEEAQRKKLLIRKFFNMSVGREMAISIETRPLVDSYVRPVEIRGFYERNIENYRREEQAKVEAIFIRVATFEQPGVSRTEAQAAARAYAELLVDRARGGESFDELVLEAQGAPLDKFKEPFRRGTQRDYVENFVWNAQVGEISDPISTSSGFLIPKLETQTTARVLTYEETKDEIAEQIRFLKISAAQLKVQMSLVRESVVEPAAFKRELKRRFKAQTEEVLNALSI